MKIWKEKRWVLKRETNRGASGCRCRHSLPEICIRGSCLSRGWGELCRRQKETLTDTMSNDHLITQRAAAFGDMLIFSSSYMCHCTQFSILHRAMFSGLYIDSSAQCAACKGLLTHATH